MNSPDGRAPFVLVHARPGPCNLTWADVRHRLIDDALRDPAAGIGKPGPLRHMLAGAGSRRISEEHRLACLVDGDDIVILQARFHYK